MKYCLLVCAGLLSVFTVRAQANLYHKNDVINGVLRLQSAHAHYKTTSGTPSERVIAISMRDTVTGPLSDSVHFVYSASNNSAYDYNDMIYAYNYPYAATPMFNFRGIYTTPQVRADTIRHWTNSPLTLVYGAYEMEYATYGSSAELMAFRHDYVDSATNSNTAYANTFNTAGSISKGCWMGSVSGVMDSAFKQYFTYDASNRLTDDSLYEMHLGTWHKVAHTRYTYDGTGNLIQIDAYAQTDTTFDSVLIEQQKYLNTYDASNRLVSVATFLYNNSTLAASGLDTFWYTGASTFHTAWTDYQYDNINHYWAPQFQMLKTLHAAGLGIGLPDTILTNGYDSVLSAWVPQEMQIASYDTANNPVTLLEYDYNFTAFPTLPNYTTHYYYESYTPVNVAIQPESPALRAYPNPVVQDMVIEGLTGINAGTLVLYNMAGQMVMRMHVGVTNGRASADLSGMQAGTYGAVVFDASGRFAGSIHIVHL